MGVNPGGTTSPSLVGATPVDLVGKEKMKILEEGWPQATEATSLFLFSLGHWVLWS